MEIRLEHLTKAFKGNKGETQTVAVNDLDITIPDGKLVGLLGPSGCGKSTTLYMISGLLEPTSGRIWFGDEDVTDLSPEKRGIGLVFQNYALYPHMTVYKNIAFPLENLRVEEKVTKDGQEVTKKRKLTAAEIDIMVKDTAKLVQIENLLDRKPNQLSGGQQQRVAIARALVSDPVIILADEATGNLDTRTSYEIMSLFQQLNAQGKTIAFVTHEPDIAQFTTRTIMLRDGKVIKDEPVNTLSAQEFLLNLPLQND